MARPKEKIQREWDVALNGLNAAIQDTERATDGGTVTEADLRRVDDKYDEWKELLDEALAKIGEWRNEKDKERVAWMKFVNTQSTKTKPNFVTKIARLRSAAETAIGSRKALEELTNDIEKDALPKLERVDGLLKQAAAAVTKGNASEAIKQQGVALNLLKGISGYSNPSGLKKQAGVNARKYGVALKDVNLRDRKLTTLFNRFAIGYKDLVDEADRIDGEIERLADEFAEGEPETSNNDREYQTHLKQSMKNYKSVVDFAKAGLAKLKKAGGQIGTLEQVLGRTVAETTPPLVKAVVKVHDVLYDQYKAVDSHIQETIRTTTSTFSAKATEWGITGDDRTKSLAPLMNRAFALNYQAKALYEASADRLIAVLEQLDSKFDSAEAKRALAEIDT
jgi:hypothetical protein